VIVAQFITKNHKQNIRLKRRWWHTGRMTDVDLNSLNAEQLRTLAAQLIDRVATHEDQWQQLQQRHQSTEQRNRHLESVIAKLTHEVALLRRLKYGKHSEKLSPLQRSLLEDIIDADTSAIEQQWAEQLGDAHIKKKPAAQPRRVALPAELPRVKVLHEPDSTRCQCGCQLKRIGEDVSEKLDYTPGVFSVEQHIRGKWVCGACETLTQAPVAPHVIDKGLPTTGLLAHVLVAKYADHLPLYRQEGIFARAGYPIARSTLADWVGRSGHALQPLAEALRESILSHPVVHADETPVPVLEPGKKKTGRAYIWAYCTTAYADTRAVVYDFAPGRAGEHARRFLEGWQGKLICDDYSGYKASFGQGVTEVACMAHARRKFFELHEAGKSTLAATALEQIGRLYDIERQALGLDEPQRHRLRQQHAKPIADDLHTWLLAHRQKVPDGTATAKAMDYSLKRWRALMRYLDDGAVPIDNNQVENQMRPWALGRKNWLFAGSLRSGRRAAAVMSLIQSARLNGHDPYAYLRDVLARLPTQRASAIDELLPHNWSPENVVKV